MKYVQYNPQTGQINAVVWGFAKPNIVYQLDLEEDMVTDGKMVDILNLVLIDAPIEGGL